MCSRFAPPLVCINAVVFRADTDGYGPRHFEGAVSERNLPGMHVVQPVFAIVAEQDFNGVQGLDYGVVHFDLLTGLPAGGGWIVDP
jgi:hypothetical protein